MFSSKVQPSPENLTPTLFVLFVTFIKSAVRYYISKNGKFTHFNKRNQIEAKESYTNPNLCNRAYLCNPFLVKGCSYLCDHTGNRTSPAANSCTKRHTNHLPSGYLEAATAFSKNMHLFCTSLCFLLFKYLFSLFKGQWKLFKLVPEVSFIK